MVELSGDPAIKRAGSVKGASDYADKLLSEQKAAKKTIEKTLKKEIVVENNYTLLFNGFSFTGTLDMIKEINKNEEMTAFVAPTFDLPKTVASTELIHAQEMWALGYTGKGTAVAILDTGVRTEHEAFSVNPTDVKYTENGMKKIIEQYGEYMHAGKNVRKLFESDKVPFAYDYYGNEYGSKHRGNSDHGTHVAGIAAGNNGKDFKGVAYDAQVIAMQVFDYAGGARWDIIMLAIEDCAYLGVDAINLSLGSPAGFSTYYEESYSEIFDLLNKNGIAIAAAAGNEGSTATGNAWGGYQLAANPDSGVVGSPSTWKDMLSVASSENGTVCAAAIKVGEDQFGYADPFKGTELAFDTLSGSYKYVLCGQGHTEEMSGLDLEGKIAVIQRGDITFTEKVANAAAKGAIAAIIYNNQDGVINMSIEAEIPAVSILKVDGDKLIAAAKDGTGKLTVTDDAYIDYTAANVISSFSSVGTTADLKIKPEITAPGGGITSCIGFGDNDSYDTWSGTSMATPHVAGGIAIVKEYVEKKFPNKTAAEQLDITYAILMSTATQLDGELVREQGAGLMNMQGALTTNAYLTDMAGGRPKLELDEIKKDKFTLQFKLVNFGDKDITYDLNTQVLIDTPYAGGTYGEYTVYITDFDALDVTEDCDVKADKTVKVNSGKTVTVKVEVTMHEDLLDDIKDLFAAGTFAEGYVTLTPKATSEGAQDATLSIPFLGFVGDWDYPAMIDYGYYWQDATGDYNWYSNPELLYNYIGYSDDEDMLFGAGINPYGDGTMPEGSFTYDRIAVSPGVSDIDYIAFSLLRNPRSLNLHVEDENGNVLGYLTDYDDYIWRKEYMGDVSYSYSDLEIPLDYSQFPENKEIHIVLETILDHEGYTVEGNQNGEWDVPVIIDGTAPFVTDVELKNKNFTVKAFDTNYIAKIGVYADAALETPLYEELFYADHRAEEETVKLELDKKDNKLVYVAVYDYAQNVRIYTFNTELETLTEQPDLMKYASHNVIWADSFEDEATYDGWDLLDVDGDGNDWGIVENAELASEGKRFAASVATEDGEISNWIISPLITIPEDENTYEIAFDMAATGTDESFSCAVLYPQDDGSYEIANYLITSALSGEEYRTFTADLSEYAGESVCIGWEHNYNEGYALRLDNIELYYLDSFVSYEPAYHESFEGSASDWNAVDADGDKLTFVRIKNESFASDGAAAMFSQAQEAGKAEECDNWLISDAVKLAKEPSLSYLTFDCISFMGLGDRYEVYASTNSSVSEMKTLLYAGTASETWTNVAVNLSEFAGKTVYIGIRQVYAGGMMFGIDNIKCYTLESSTEYMVTYIDSTTNKVVGMQRVADGTVLECLPNGPDSEKYVFTGWDYNNTPITKNTTIKSTFALRGDVTGDGKVNTADASLLLRWIAFDTVLTRIEERIGDYNYDGVLNTGDAAAILRYAAGMNP